MCSKTRRHHFPIKYSSRLVSTFPLFAISSVSLSRSSSRSRRSFFARRTRRRASGRTSERRRTLAATTHTALAHTHAPPRSHAACSWRNVFSAYALRSDRLFQLPSGAHTSAGHDGPVPAGRRREDAARGEQRWTARLWRAHSKNKSECLNVSCVVLAICPHLQDHLFIEEMRRSVLLNTGVGIGVGSLLPYAVGT